MSLFQPLAADKTFAMHQPAAAKPPDRWLARWSPNRFTGLVILTLGFLYFLILIPINLVGSRDEDMLIVAAGGSADTKDIYGHIVEMTQPASTMRGRIHNWLHYGYYYYGYPFFLLAAFATLPVQFAISHGLLSPDHVVAGNMLAMRQMSGLYLALAAGLLIYAWTGFRTLLRSTLAFLFVLLVPLVFTSPNTLHPEPLLALLMVLTILTLAKDRLRFGRYFYLAGLLCGYAIGVKFTALFFGLSILTYLLLGTISRPSAWFSDRASTEDTPCRLQALPFFVIQGAIFTAFTIAGFVIANPLFAWDRAVRNDYLQKAKETTFWIAESGELRSVSSADAEATDTPRTPSQAYAAYVGHWWVAGLLMAISVFAIAVDRRTRLLNILILGWSAPLLAYFFWKGSADRSHYMISGLVPLMSCAANPAVWDFWKLPRHSERAAGFVLFIALLGVGGWEGAFYIQTSAQYYKDALSQEKIPSITAGEDLVKTVLNAVPLDGTYCILRDKDPITGQILYIPEKQRFDVQDFGVVGTYKDIVDKDPRLLVLLNANIESFTDPKTLEHYASLSEKDRAYSIGQSDLQACHEFYRDAKADRLRGYRKIQTWKNELATAFEQR